MNTISNQAIWRVLVIHIIVEHQKNNNVSLGNLEIRMMELSRQTVQTADWSDLISQRNPAFCSTTRKRSYRN